MYRDARLLHAAGVRLRNPMATPRDILVDWLVHAVGFPHTDLIQESFVEPPLSVLAELRSYLRVLDDLQIPYVLGGSLASSVLGISRNTRDADIAVEPFPGKEE